MRQVPGRVETVPPSPRPRLATALLRLAASAAGLAVAASLAGCEFKSFLNPGELVDPEKSNRLDANGKARPRLQPILGELDLGVTRTPSSFTSARDVRQSDLQVSVQDYRVGPGDEVRVSINDLLQIGQPYIEVVRVSDTGKLNLPNLPDPVQIAGLTEADAAREIDQRYVEAGIFQAGQNATSVLVYTAQNRTFGVLGNVGQPARYLINRSDFRLLDAYTLAGGRVDPQVTSEVLYVIRPTGTRPNAGTGNNGGNNNNTGGNTGGGGRDPLLPGSDAGDLPDGPDGPAADDAPVYAVMQGQPANGRAAGQGQGVTFTAPQPVEGYEIIRVPLLELLNGDLRYNLVIRPDDTLFIPPVLSGEYYVGGHVLRPGVYAIIPGRKLTVKQAIISGGMLDEVAIPGRTQLIRRVDDQDCFVRVDLSKIFVGLEPDIYLQANDIILVGTNLPAPFLATFRNAFRITYGFGFLYDRNFAYDNSFRGF